LKIVMPQYRGSSHTAILAVYPSRDFMPAKVSVFLDMLADGFGTDPYWNKGLDIGKPLPRSKGGGSSRKTPSTVS
jgi:hypothetical protein